MPAPRTNPPTVAWIYGLLGLIPFFGAACGDVLRLPPGAVAWRTVLAVYAAVILSFLGGARWGMEIGRPAVRAGPISLSMLPSVAGFLLLVLAGGHSGATLGGLAAAHLLQWAWDVRSLDPPTWYPRLRVVLTGGAVMSLVAALVFG